MKNTDIKEKVNADTISKRDNVYTVRKGFYYKFGGTAIKFVTDVENNIQGAKIIDYGEKFVRFNGGASIASQSHWFVKFTI